MYDAIADPYCYKGTTVLKNIPGIHEPAALIVFETVSVAQRADEPLPGGRLGIRHYCAIHHHLFQDVYRWAGQFRTVRVTKGDSTFCYPENIAAEMRKLFQGFRDQNYLRGRTEENFPESAAHFLAELNAIHPFREGNGRSQLTFLMLVAEQAKHPFNLERLEPERFLSAMISSFKGNEVPLAQELGLLLK
jgi:cell filamentation protein